MRYSINPINYSTAPYHVDCRFKTEYEILAPSLRPKLRVVLPNVGVASRIRDTSIAGRKELSTTDSIADLVVSRCERWYCTCRCPTSKEIRCNRDIIFIPMKVCQTRMELPQISKEVVWKWRGYSDGLKKTSLLPRRRGSQMPSCLTQERTSTRDTPKTILDCASNRLPQHASQHHSFQPSAIRYARLVVMRKMIGFRDDPVTSNRRMFN